MKQFNCGEIIPGYKMILLPESTEAILRPSVVPFGKKEDGMRAARASQTVRTNRIALHFPAVA